MVIQAQDGDPYTVASQGYETSGQPQGDEHHYADGRKKGEVTYRFGAQADVTKDMPGWYIADGTQPDLVIDGVNYGKPNLTQRFVVGADGSAGFDIGDTGGSDELTEHQHDFTQPLAHGITDPNPTVSAQPVFGDHDGPTELPHSSSTVGAHDTHGAVTATEVQVTTSAVSGVWVSSYGSSANAAAARAHSAHAAHDHPAHADLVHVRTQDVALAEDDVTLTNNSPHAGGEVGDVESGPLTQLPPYLAVWPLIKVY